MLIFQNEEDDLEKTFKICLVNLLLLIIFFNFKKILKIKRYKIFLFSEFFKEKSQTLQIYSFVINIISSHSLNTFSLFLVWLYISLFLLSLYYVYF